MESTEALRCPSCSQHMEAVTLARRQLGSVRVDLCYACRAIWFDRDESPQLAPGAVIELFRRIQAHAAVARNALRTSVACPRCSGPLALTHDIGKAGPLSYFRCAQDGGRLTPFVQFLREKQFMRSLTPAELTRLRVSVQQVRCSNCGAPVDVERSGQCAYCGSPIAVLDADAVNEALRYWSEAAAQSAGRASPRVAPSFAIEQVGAVQTGGDVLDVCIGALCDLVGPQF